MRIILSCLGLYDKLGQDLSNFNYSTSRPLQEFNARTKIYNILCNKYFITDEADFAPFGYSLDREIGKTKVYENQYPLNFGTLYKKYITNEEYEELEDIEKESGMLKAVAINAEDVNTNYIEKEENLRERIDRAIDKINYTQTDISDEDGKKVSLKLEENSKKRRTIYKNKRLWI